MTTLFDNKPKVEDYDNPCNLLHLKNGLKEDKDYKLLDHRSWKIFKRQNSKLVDVPRFSIGVSQGTEEQPSSEEFVVESNFRRFEVIAYPKVKYT